MLGAPQQWNIFLPESKTPPPTHTVPVTPAATGGDWWQELPLHSSAGRRDPAAIKTKEPPKNQQQKSSGN